MAKAVKPVKDTKPRRGGGITPEVRSALAALRFLRLPSGPPHDAAPTLGGPVHARVGRGGRRQRA
jgi:hypothetical protein